MALRSLRDVNKRVVAVVFVTLAVAFSAFAFAVGQLHLFSGGYEISGVFKDSGGIAAGQDVRVAGVKSGMVTGVHADFAHGDVIITMRIDSDIKLGPTTHADVQLATLLGGRYIRLSGPVGTPYLDQMPDARRRIPLERTSTPFTVTDALEGATNLSGKLDFKAINKIIESTRKINTPTQEKLKLMLANFNKLAGVLDDNAPQIRQLISNSKNLTGTLAAKDQQLKQLIDAGQVLLQHLVARRDQLAATIGNSSQLVATLTATIDAHKKELDSVLADLHLLTTRLAPNMDALNADFALLGPTFTQIANTKATGGQNWIEGLLTGLGPLQPPGPISSRHTGGSG